MRERLASPVRVIALRGGQASELPDRVVTEEPLEIRAGGPGQAPVPLTVTMRTPGHDFELAVGFLTTEGIVTGTDDVTTVRYCDLPPGEEQQYNIVTVALRHPFDARAHQRAFATSASCGVCGKQSLEQLEVRCVPVAPGPVVPHEVLLALPDRLRAGQLLFDATGGLHAAGLFEASGELLALREDVGRHNALDKLAGWAVMDHHVPLSGTVLVVSGRVSFEIVQKAAVVGIPFIAAVGAPSSLAVDAARSLDITLAGFIRADRANLYTHPERVA